MIRRFAHRRPRVAALCLLLQGLSACAPAVDVPVIEPSPLPAGERLLVAGDDAATPLMRHLADHFSARHPGPTVVVEAPLGAAGALRALEDGALDAALVVTAVGDLPRVPAGMMAQVIAWTDAILVTGAASGVRRLAVAELLALLRGENTAASRRLSSLLLAPDIDPAQAAIARRMPGLAQAFEAAIERRRWPVFYEGQARRDALRRTPGALAAADTGSLRLLGVPFWPVELVELPANAVPARLAVQLVTPERPKERIAALLRFLTSPEGRALLVDVGYGAP